MRRWLKLKDACDYTGLGQHRIKALARQGVIVGTQDPASRRGDWVFDRLSLDSYRQAQMDVAHQAALDLAKRLGL